MYRIKSKFGRCTGPELANERSQNSIKWPKSIACFRCHATKTTTAKRSMDKVRIRKMKGGKYAQSSPRFRPVHCLICEIFGKIIQPNVQSFVWRCNMASGTVTEFCYESANSSNSVSNTVTVQKVKSPKINFSLTYITAVSATT